MLRRPVRRTRQGRYQINLSTTDRQALRQLVPQFTALLEDPEQPGLRRLFPPAYAAPEDREHEEEYRRLMREELAARHREALEVVVATAAQPDLSEEELLSWLRALNSVRLVLGTLLDVSEDEASREPQSLEEATYRWLSYLQEWGIAALSGET